jgi:protein-S-isoprenylcysteine O-methyltransferase Ste14
MEMILRPIQLVGLAWATFIAVWLVSAFATNRTVQREGGAGIGRRIFLGLVAWYLVFGVGDSRFGVLSERFVPRGSWIAWLGAVMAVVGVAFAIWARIHIGRYWSGNVVLKEGHQLIRTGPYARIRHPIYTGMLLGLAGSALAFGHVGALLAFAIYTLMFWLKARKEEALLAGQFGAAFEGHRRHTGFFLPRLFTPPEPRNDGASARS